MSPSRDASDFPDDESVCRTMWYPLLSPGMSSSSKNVLRCCDSTVPCPSAYNSASAELVATVCCVLELAEIVVLNNCVRAPDVDFRVFVHPAQSLSV